MTLTYPIGQNFEEHIYNVTVVFLHQQDNIIRAQGSNINFVLIIILASFPVNCSPEENNYMISFVCPGETYLS